jgi:hypothetical protein
VFSAEEFSAKEKSCQEHFCHGVFPAKNISLLRIFEDCNDCNIIDAYVPWPLTPSLSRIKMKKTNQGLFFTAQVRRAGLEWTDPAMKERFSARVPGP